MFLTSEQQKILMVTDFSSPVEIRAGYKEVMALAIMIIIIVMVLLAVNFDEFDELVDPDISIEVSRSWHSQYAMDGQLPVEGKEWIILDVNITNMNRDIDFQVSVPHFYAETGNGDMVWVFNSED